MARYNEILVGRFNRFLQRFLSMKGSPPAPQLAGDISATLALDDAQNLENRFPIGWRSYAILSNAAAVAAQQSAVFIKNPVGSNVIAVVEKITIGTGAAASSPQVGFTAPLNPTAGVASTGPRDSRQTGSSVVLAGSSTNAGAPAGTQYQANQAASSTVDVIVYDHQEFVLMPGAFMTVWGNLVNQAVGASFFWRERALEEGELT